MSKQKVTGPYRVIRFENTVGMYEVVKMVNDTPQSLIPKAVYMHRQAAYRRSLVLNERWSKGDKSV